MGYCFDLEVKTVGSFVETEHGRRFDYRESPECVMHVPAHGGGERVFPHLIFVGPGGVETRRALVLETVAHVVIDETEDGFLVEKWNIKKHRKFK